MILNTNISVVLPVYNGSSYLKENILSVLNQEFVDFEFLISDDNSQDNSLHIINEFQHYPNVKIFSQKKNLGLFANLNFLINQSSSPLIKLWSQDDIMLPQCLLRTILFHQQYPAIALSYCGVNIIDEHDRIIIEDKEDSTPTLINPEVYAIISAKWGCLPGNIANVTLDRQKVLSVGGFNEQMKVSGDFELWTRLSEIYTIGRTKEKLINLRRHNGQLSRNIKSAFFEIKENLPIYVQLLSRIKNLFQHQQITRHYHEVILPRHLWTAFLLLSKGKIKLGLQTIYLLSKEHSILLIFISMIRNRVAG